VIVVIPAYEPDSRLLALVHALRTAAPCVRLLVVDDGSGPAYRHLFDAARRLGATVLEHPVNRGKGAALKAGFRFEYEPDVLLRAARQGHTVGQIEIATIYLEGNASSHFRPVVDSARTYAPLLLFLLSSFAAFLIDTAAVLTLNALTGSLLLSVAGARALSSAVNFLVNRRFVSPRPLRGP
jgi:glycosyltransferase involved in cell wall biosynthesis